MVVKMRHDAHYVEEVISRSGAAIGRMIPIEEIQPNAEQPRKDHGDLRGLTESVLEKGVLEPLLVRHLPEPGKYLIISGERRFHAARKEQEDKMRDLVRRFALGLVNREQAREERQPDKRPRNAIFRFASPAKEFNLVLRFRKSNVQRAEVIQTLRRIIATLEKSEE